VALHRTLDNSFVTIVNPGQAESSELRTKSIQLASAWAALEQQQRVDLRDSLEREAQLHELAGREANRAKAVELAEGERARRLSLPNAATPAQSEQPSAAGVALPLPAASDSRASSVAGKLFVARSVCIYMCGFVDAQASRRWLSRRKKCRRKRSKTRTARSTTTPAWARLRPASSPCSTSRPNSPALPQVP
jgi:hypothetical protein